MMISVLAGLLCGWILSWFGVDVIFIDAVNEWFGLNVTASGYYGFMCVTGLLGWVFKRVNS